MLRDAEQRHFVWSRVRVVKHSFSTPHSYLCVFIQLLAVTVMGFARSAGRLSESKSLYGYLIGIHTYYSFASPSHKTALS